MTKMMTLPAADVPQAIAASIGGVIESHGLSFSRDLLDEIVHATVQSLLAIDESLVAAAEPTMADRLAVGETLRSLAMMGRPNAHVARALERVGSWLSQNAKAEMPKADGEAA